MASTTSAPLIPDQIMPNLYISDLHTARAVLSPNYYAPGRPKIRYVLSLLNTPQQQPVVFPGLEPNYVLKLVVLPDSINGNLLDVLSQCIDFIKASLANRDGGILIHCHQGISRSASVMIAFVMEEMDIDYDTALRYVRTGRSKVNPNKGFVSQLEMWRRLVYNIRDSNGDLKQEYLDFKAANDKPIAGCAPSRPSHEQQMKHS